MVKIVHKKAEKTEKVAEKPKKYIDLKIKILIKCIYNG